MKSIRVSSEQIVPYTFCQFAQKGNAQTGLITK